MFDDVDPFMPLRDRADAVARDATAWLRWIEAFAQHIAAVNPSVRALTDWRLAAGSGAPPIGSIITTYKDLIDVRGFSTRCGSLSFARRPAASARIVRELEPRGFWTLGKAATTEFGVGSNFDCRNPLFPDFGPSGSSSGSAAAVAGGLCDISVGTDTIGSSRWPARNCGVAGLKLTYTPSLQTGLVPIAPSLDTIGLLARSVDDLEYAWSTRRLASLLLRRSVPRFSTLGVVTNFRACQCDPQVEKAFRHFVGLVALAGFDVREIELDWWRFREDVWRIAARELYDVHVALARSTSLQYLPATLRAIAYGASISDRDYRTARANRRTAREAASRMFREQPIGALLLPLDGRLPQKLAVPPPAAVLGEQHARKDDPSFVSLASIAAIPALCFPVALADTGAPISVQLLAARGSEGWLLKVGRELERIASGWLPVHRLRSLQNAIAAARSPQAPMCGHLA